MTFEAIKDPQEVLDYEINWATLLAETSPVDTISSSTWAASAGLTVASNSNTTTTATVWVSGGVANKYNTLTNTIVTAGGRTYERTIVVKVQSR